MLTFSLSILAIVAFSQNYNAVTPLKTVPHHFWSYYKPLQVLSDTNTFIVNYDSADAKIWGSAYLHNQSHLMNMHYTKADSSAGNNNVVNYVTVAFDSLVDPYTNKFYSPDSIGGMAIDTLIIPLIQVNHSGINDTLDVQIDAVDANGYPTSAILQDIMIIKKVMGDANTSAYASFIKIPENYSLTSGTRFAVAVKYYGAKTDSCWFIYGCGSFVGTCGGAGPYTLAEPSNYSKVSTSNGGFIANSFVLYNTYKANGLYPTANGNVFYYDCNHDSTYEQGVDGVSYFQNINVYAMVTSLPLGINGLKSMSIMVSQNYPNPFNQATQINYTITKLSNVAFSVIDITGRTIINNTYFKVAPGQHIISLNAAQYRPGVYFYTLNVNGGSVTRKMVVVE